MPDFSKSMQKAIALARRGGGELVMRRGGYWVEPSAQERPAIGPLGTGRWGGGPWEDEPDWVEVRTLRALARRGLGEFPDRHTFRLKS